ncbi:MAG TPA: class I SAM-dependent methyltransferase [Chthonomonadaceae bacterium]|nr:class I SAM-dependent methyltransferase [Chthonomonadaceae bacterium]
MALPVYDAIAEWYAAYVQNSPAHSLALPAVLELCGNVTGQQVCDLACGEGIVARALAERGAVVTGIDLSIRLLEIASRQEQAAPLGISYLQGDAQTLDNIPDARFDTVVCNLALMDFPDLPATLATVARLLRPQGRFVFTIVHPCFQTPDSRWTGKAGGTVKREVRAYFREGYWRSDNPNGVRGNAGCYHRTLSAYVNALTEVGLIVERMAEPQAQDEVSARVPGYREVPVILAVRCILMRPMSASTA